MNIKKMVLNTVLATLAVLLSVSLFIFNASMLFFPKPLADAADGLNVRLVALPASRISYERSGDINDLAAFVERAIKYNDYASVSAYAKQLTLHKHYSDFSDFKDGQGVTDISDYKSYIEGNYLISLYASKQEAQCIAEAEKLAGDTYSAQSPLGFLVRHIMLSEQRFEPLNSLLITMYENSSSDEEKKALSRDLYFLYFYSGDTANGEYWRIIYTNMGNTEP